MTGGRILRVLFVVVACISLLVNAVFIGIGVRLADRGILGNGNARILAGMPAETRRTYVDALRSNKPELRRLADELKERRREMLTIAAKTPVDAAALASAMQQVRTATTRLQSASHEALLGSLNTASDAD